MRKRSEEYFSKRISETKSAEISRLRGLYGSKVVRKKYKDELEKFHEYSYETYQRIFLKFQKVFSKAISIQMSIDHSNRDLGTIILDLDSQLKYLTSNREELINIVHPPLPESEWPVWRRRVKGRYNISDSDGCSSTVFRSRRSSLQEII